MRENSWLRRYAAEDAVTQYQARFILYFSFSSIIALIAAMVYGVPVQLQASPSSGINVPLLTAELVTLILFVWVIFLLVRGQLNVSGHLLITVSLLAVWTVIFVDRSEALIQLDSIFFIFAILSSTPLLVKKKVFPVLFYTLINIPALWVLLMTQRERLALGRRAEVDLLSDAVVALIFVAFTHFTLFIINRDAMNRLRQDIRRREAAELSLRQNESRMETLLRFQNEMLETAAVWINTLDAQGRISFWNKAAEHISGYSREEVLGHGNVWSWLYPEKEYRDIITEKAEEIIRSGARVENFETLITCKSGEKRTISWFSNTLHDERGESAGSIALGIDLTLQKREQLERERLEIQMHQVQKMESIGRLAGGIAHDFNNLLTAILGSADLALLRTEESNPCRDRLETIKAAAESAAGLTRRLLAFSRKQLIEPRTFDLNSVIEHLQDMFKRVIGENIVLSFRLGEPLPLIKADPGQIEQIIMNLVVNASDAMPSGGHLTIESGEVLFDDEYCRYHPGVSPGYFVMLAVSDTGRGISPEIREHLYEPFFSTKPPGKGTGLGLATVYGVVRQNGGAIDCYSEIDHGTTFKVYFPVCRDPRQPAAQIEENNDLPGGTETILVVEDNAHVLAFVTDTLNRLGYRVFSAVNGEEALERFQSLSEPLHLLISDVILPGMNGLELARELAKNRKEMRMLFISGYTGDLLTRSGFVEEGIHFISKPFGVRLMAQKVRQVLDSQN